MVITHYKVLNDHLTPKNIGVCIVKMPSHPYFGKGDNLVLSGVAGDEVVEVGDDVDADGAGQLVPALGHGHGGGHEGGEEEEGCLHLVLVVFGSFLQEVMTN